MIQKLFFTAFFIVCCWGSLQAQTCTTLGQTPSTAFPVCGTSTFSQSTVPVCTNSAIPVPGCSGTGALYADKNPFWYRFTCFKTGTLGLLITPNDLGDDYDWQLFDITGISNLNEVYTNISLFVVGNWSGSVGLTGASASAKNNIQCASDPAGGVPTFSKMPILQQGHIYLLLVSHFDSSQSGYKLSFGGGTAVITDPLLPGLAKASASCDAAHIYIKINKPIKCSSIAPDGSDFNILPAAASVTAATGIGCSNSFDTDSLMLTLSNPLPPGTYTITIKNGDDNNTLLDNCDRNISAGNNLPLVVLPLAPIPFDSLTKVGCAPHSLQFVFKKNILCSSIAPDGSDFVITGPSPVTIISATGNCGGEQTPIVIITLSASIFNAGTYKVKLVNGNDGNTLIDECGFEIPAGSFLNFTSSDTVSASFNYSIFKGCRTDTIALFHNGNNEVNQWMWNLADAGTSNLQNPFAYYKTFGNKKITLAVSNGICTDTSSQIVNLDNTLKASFETNSLLCPEDTATFINNSIGDITGYSWDFGNGITTSVKSPAPLHYPILSMEKIYAIRLVVENNAGCFDTSVNDIKVLKSCYIAVPSAFTPNGDGLNDFLYPLNAYKADNLEFNVYNRIGQRVFHTTDWTIKWDGTINGNPQDAGIFVWTLRYTNHDTGKKVFQKGSTMLIR